MIVGRPLIRLVETGSTMDLASRLADNGAISGTTVLAGNQTAGRGRAGRTWDTAPDSSILMSFVAHTGRERQELGAVSLLLGLAVSRTIDHVTSATSSIKWPNDVLVEGRKIAGILPVSRTLPHRDDVCLIVGIGLNVNAGTSELPETATSISVVSARTHSLADVLPVLLDNLTIVMNQFEVGDTGALWHEVDARLAFRGEQVRIEDGPRVYDGILRGVSVSGQLQLERPLGTLVGIAAGDLTRGPIAMP